MDFKQLYDLLKEFNPYPVGKHEGICREPYLVIREGLTVPSLTTRNLGISYIDIILFVPLDSYVSMAEYKKLVIAKLKGQLRKSGVETPIIPDGDIKAYTTSVEYILQKKLEG